MLTEPRYFDHDADIGIVGLGETVESAFVDAARAMFAIMVDIDSVAPTHEVEVAFEEDDLEFALVTWLNELLAAARADGLVFGAFDLKRDGATWRCRAWGEPWNERHERGVEVKGATLTMLSVEHGDGGWEARCLVDV